MGVLAFKGQKAVEQYEIPAPLKDRPEQVLQRKGYTTSYNATTKTPNWVAWHLTAAHTRGKQQRHEEKFMEDEDIALGSRATDNDYYLHHAPDGSYSVAGTLFTDCMNLPDLGSDCTVIYGHHMADGSMFQNLMLYKDQKYTDEHPYIKIYTPAGDYNLEVFAGVYYNGGTDRLYFDFASDEQFVMYCENLKAKSAISSDVEINAGDKIIGLCTCTYEFDNARYVVYGKLNAADLS